MKILNLLTAFGLTTTLGLLIGCAGDGGGPSTTGSTATTATTAGTTATTAGSTATTAGGTIDFAFSSVSGTNATTSRITSAVSVIAAENANLTNISSNTLIGMTDTRTITVMLMGGGSLAPVGTELPVENNGDSDSFATVVYTEAGATINPPRGWVGISGKATVVSRSGSQVRVKLDNVRMTKETDNDTAATGAFTLTGAMTGTKSNP